MAREKIVDAARRVAGPVLEEMGYELADLKFVMEGGRWHLQFFIDKPGGVTIDDCQYVSREIDTLIEVEDFIQGAYVLEVSSPGLDRPLYKPSDYKRFTGNLAKVKTNVPVDGQKALTGRIDSPDEEGFNLIVHDGKKTVYIKYGQVEKARLEVEF
ncbi:MAG: ribosome maturation factor RimP [Nitrospirota bacterium]